VPEIVKRKRRGSFLKSASAAFPAARIRCSAAERRAVPHPRLYGTGVKDRRLTDANPTFSPSTRSCDVKTLAPRFRSNKFSQR
jgi:hypothetical protein